MDIHSLKVDLIHWLVEIQDVAVLEQIQEFKENQEKGLSRAHKELLDERLTSFIQNPERLQEWEDVMKDIEKDL